MIAAVKGWHTARAALIVHAVLTAPLLLLPQAAMAADDLNGAARELAGRTALLAGAGTPVSVSCRNASSLGSAEFNQARSAFENYLRQAGGRVEESPTALDVRLTVSENPAEYLLVEETRKGEERQVWMAAWKRTPQTLSGATGVSLASKLLWEQEEPILDIAFPAGFMLLLAPSRITLFTRSNDRWEPRRSLPLTSPRPWPRDLRGRLRISGPRFQAFLPGLTCAGAADPELTLDCHAADEPWVLESGSRALLLANFAAARNFFDGRVVTQNGAPKSAPPFYTAAALEERGQALWFLTLVDGRTLVLDGAWNTAAGAPASLPAWGSDIAGIDARCGPATQVLATRPGEGEADSIQSWSLADRTVVPVSPPVSFPGPVTALWTSGGTSAIAVSHDLVTGKYVAYVLTVACGS